MTDLPSDTVKVTFKQVDDNNNLIGSSVVTVRSNIFRPISPHASIGGKWTIRFRKLLVKLIDLTFPTQRRYFYVHTIVKDWFTRPALKLLVRVMGKNLVTEDSQIPQHWYNNHIRLFRWCFDRGLKDMYEKWVYNQLCLNGQNTGEPVTEDPVQFMHRSIKGQPYRFRKTFLDIWTTEMLEDTADREQCNFMVMHIAHQMMQLYGVSPEERRKVPVAGVYPMYLAKGPHWPEYFVRHAMFPLWRQPQEEGDKNGENQDKTDEKHDKDSTPEQDKPDGHGLPRRGTVRARRPRRSQVRDEPETPGTNPAPERVTESAPIVPVPIHRTRGTGKRVREL